MAEFAAMTPFPLPLEAYAGEEAMSLLQVLAHRDEFVLARCPDCRETIVARRAYWIGACRVTADGRCPACHCVIPGRWRQA